MLSTSTECGMIFSMCMASRYVSLGVKTVTFYMTVLYRCTGGNVDIRRVRPQASSILREHLYC